MRWVYLIGLLAIWLASAGIIRGQTASTGALSGITLDPSGSILPGVLLNLSGDDGSEPKSLMSDESGSFWFASLRPGTYRIEASKKDFRPLTLEDLHVYVTETVHLELHFELTSHIEHAEVTAEPLMVQLDSAALGRVVDTNLVNNLPLVNRNFTQITGLSPGVFTGVDNAGELGSGGMPLSQVGKSNDGIYVHGARSYDNNWQLDGISVSDVLSSGSASGGIPIPNPDTMEEFKVQTGLYDAAYGRGTGANVSVITRKGGNDYHGSVFEFVRNKVLNANDFFLNETGAPRPNLNQNQFGAAVGGPIQRNKLFFFASYQGTRQLNGLASGQARIACSATLSEPPLTNDRSPAALGQLFGGLPGALGGVAVNPDGSNINPVALALLNYKLPNGQYLIPTPQIVDSSRPFASQGFSTFSEPCQFNENQGMANLDYTPSEKSRFSARFFLSDANQQVTFPGNGLNFSGNIPGFLSPGDSQYVVFSLAHSYALSSTRLNQARVAYVRTMNSTGAHAPFAWSDVGVSEGSMNENNQLPSLAILGSLSMAPAFPRTYTQNSFVLSDDFSLLKGAHALKFGGSLTRLQENLNFAGFGSFLEFLSWPDFLLGLDGAANGTQTFSNVFESADVQHVSESPYRAIGRPVCVLGA